MSGMRAIGIVAVLTLVSTPGVFAAGEEFDAGRMIDELERKLRLSQEEMSKLKPELEKALEDKSRELKGTVDDAVEKGFIELENLSKDLEEASQRAEQGLKRALDSEQAKELKEYLAKLDREALEEARRGLVAELTALLELSKEQVEEIEPVLREYVDRTGNLLGQFAKGAGKAAEDFFAEYEDLARETKSRLERSLDEVQLEKLQKRLGETGEKIRGKFSSGE